MTSTQQPGSPSTGGPVRLLGRFHLILTLHRGEGGGCSPAVCSGAATSRRTTTTRLNMRPPDVVTSTMDRPHGAANLATLVHGSLAVKPIASPRYVRAEEGARSRVPCSGTKNRRDGLSDRESQALAKSPIRPRFTSRGVRPSNPPSIPVAPPRADPGPAAARGFATGPGLGTGYPP